MAQETLGTTSEGTSYTFNSTTDATTITISDDQFAMNVILSQILAELKEIKKRV